jgi:DNA polymerase I-like protein with 3'-5' exonuclease and polymerase domains
MKQALIILDELATRAALDYKFVGNIHDEIQAEVHEDDAEAFANLAERAIVLAGEHFKLRCPLAGTATIGNTWEETH